MYFVNMGTYPCYYILFFFFLPLLLSLFLFLSCSLVLKPLCLTNERKKKVDNIFLDTIIDTRRKKK